LINTGITLNKKKGSRMNKKSVLVVSNPETIKPDFLQWISDTDTFDMTFADTQEQAIEFSSQQLFDLVIIDKTDAEVNVKKLGKILPILNSEVLLVGYEGESSEKIEEKIRLAFDYRKFKRLQNMIFFYLTTRQPRNNGLTPFSLN